MVHLLFFCHHTHCISGHETHKGVPIYYSLGNFLFTKTNSNKDWYTGLILEINIIDNKLFTKLHPVRQQKESFQLDLLDGKDKKHVLEKVKYYSEIIQTSTRLKQEWENFIEFKYSNYLNYWSPLSFVNNKYLRAIFNKLGIRMINKKGIALKLNLIRCEAHVDLSKKVTEKYLTK